MSDTQHLTIEDIKAASERLAGAVKQTPVMSSNLLNTWLGHDIQFKCECLQRTGSFKIRGATNFLAKYLSTANDATHVIASSSGNHAQAVARAASKKGLPAHIYASANISPIKAAATQAYGAQLHLFDNRELADAAVKEAAQQEGAVWIPPYNHPDIIAGQGTAAYEAFQQTDKHIDAVFAPCGGGGLLSGSLVSTKHFVPDAQVIGAEPLEANDAAESLRTGIIQSLQSQPNTLADGAATPRIGEHTFPYLKQLDDFVEVNEERIAYWTQWLHHLLKLHIEPTCAMTMEAVWQWAQRQSNRSTALVILSGGNISQQSMLKIWQKDHLQTIPKAC